MPFFGFFCLSGGNPTVPGGGFPTAWEGQGQRPASGNCQNRNRPPVIMFSSVPVLADFRFRPRIDNPFTE